MRIHYMLKRYGQIIEKWPAWKEEADCTETQKDMANLRELRSDEVCLDIENPNDLNLIILRLCQEEYNFDVWATGSRGYHVMLQFPEMEMEG